MLIQGRAWIFGDDVNTDLINPGPVCFAPVEEAAPHTLEAVDPAFSKNVQRGDIVVAGKNFGCGSSRELAAQVLKYLGIGCVLAESFARIFFRNAIAIGLPALVFKDLAPKLVPLDMMSVSVDLGEAKIERTGETIKGTPIPKRMQEVISAGGIDELLKNLKVD